MPQKLSHATVIEEVKVLDSSAWRKSSYNHLKFQDDFDFMHHVSYLLLSGAILQSGMSIRYSDIYLLAHLAPKIVPTVNVERRRTL